MNWRLPVHPWLWALAPVLSLWARNAENVRTSQAVQAAVLALAIASVVFLLGLLFFRRLHRVSIVASVVLILFFSYGRVFEAVTASGWIDSHRLVHVLLSCVSGALLFASIVLVLRLAKGLEEFSGGMNIAAGFMVVAAVVSFPFGKWNEAADVGVRVFEEQFAKGIRHVEAVDTSSLPDVYYIILDGYARDDVLESVYGFDNSQFTTWLEESGFYVAKESAANYPMTHYSLPSSMSLNYLDPVLEQLPAGSLSQLPFFEMMRRPVAARLFQARGYRFVHFATNFRGTEDSEIADEVVSYKPTWFQNEFMQVLVRTTAARGLCVPMAELHLNSFAKLQELCRDPRPKFVFAHFILPHHPYVFDRHGNRRKDVLMDMDFRHGTGGWRNRQPYIDQLIHVNRLTRETIRVLLSASRTPPIIILQSDHGSASTVGPNWRNFRREVVMRERLPILNAYHVPESIRTNLYPSISPVNSFRVVMNGLFDSRMPLLPDRHYMTWYQLGNRVMDVTEIVRRGAPEAQDVARADQEDEAATLAETRTE